MTSGLVGTELHKLLSKWGFKENKLCSCHRYKKVLDRLGVEWCKHHIPRIVRLLKKSAIRRKLPFSPWIAKQFIRRAIRNAGG